jgi:ADP-ribose pyrophosphatase YjhB (NUDIX family)
MNPLITIRDEDIFPKDYKYPEFDNCLPMERVAVRCIVLDDQNNLALCGTKYKSLPGGGVESGETLEDVCVRECLEEVGCAVEIVEKIGTADEYRGVSQIHQTTHCFVARLVGEKGVPQTTQQDEQGMKVHWYPINNVAKLLADEVQEIPFESYNSCLNVRVHQAFVNKYLDLKSI